MLRFDFEMGKQRATKCRNCPNPPMPARAVCRECFNARTREKRGGKARQSKRVSELTMDDLRPMALGNLMRLLDREAGTSAMQEAYNFAAQIGALPDEGGAGLPIGIRIEGLRTLIPELPELADVAQMMLQRRIVDSDGEAAG